MNTSETVDQTNPLFRERVPSAAAMQLAIVLASMVEHHLVTLDTMRERKSTSKSDLSRQERICKDAVQHCIELGVEPRGLRGHRCDRLAEEIETHFTRNPDLRPK